MPDGSITYTDEYEKTDMPRAGIRINVTLESSIPWTRAPHEPPSAAPQATNHSNGASPEPSTRPSWWEEKVADAAAPTDSWTAPSASSAASASARQFCRAWRWRPATAGSALRAFGDGPLRRNYLEMSEMMGLRLGLLCTYILYYGPEEEIIYLLTMVRSLAFFFKLQNRASFFFHFQKHISYLLCTARIGSHGIFIFQKKIVNTWKVSKQWKNISKLLITLRKIIYKLAHMNLK
jgi:hypothetical protein